MDNPAAQVKSNEPKKNSLLKELEFGVGGVMIGIGTFLLMLFVLNYFNIVSLSLVFPKYFGFLPHRATLRGSTPRGVEPLQRTSQSQLPSQRDVPPGTSPTPTPLLVSTLETCDVKKEGNPLVNDVKKIKVKSATGSAEKEIIVGNFLGNIQTVTYNVTDKSALIELIAPRGDQVYAFKNINEEKGLVRDDTLGKDATLADLARGNSVFVSFNCDPSLEKEKQFRITRISIIGKL